MKRVLTKETAYTTTTLDQVGSDERLVAIGNATKEPWIFSQLGNDFFWLHILSGTTSNHYSDEEITTKIFINEHNVTLYAIEDTQEAMREFIHNATKKG